MDSTIGSADPLVVVAVDGSDASVAAVTTAQRLFGASARLLLTNVASPTVIAAPVSPLAATPMVPPVPDVTDGEELREVARSVAAHTASTAHVAAGSAEVVGLLGDPADEVIALAEERHADVIVVGTHERGWLSRLLTTSVADEVRSRSSIPVLVVPAE